MILFIGHPFSEEKSNLPEAGKQQNIEQRIPNVEVNPSSFCGSVFDIRHSIFLAA